MLFALGIRHIGSKAAALLTEHFGSIEAIAAATAEEIEQIDGIGSVLADSAAEFFSLPETAAMLESLKKSGVNMKSLKEVKDNRFAGMTFVLTGTLEHFTRA